MDNSWRTSRLTCAHHGDLAVDHAVSEPVRTNPGLPSRSQQGVQEKNPLEFFEELSTEISTGRNRLPVENRCDMAAGRGPFLSSERARGVSPVTPICLGQHGGPAAAGEQTRLSFACVFDHGGSDRPDRGSD